MLLVFNREGEELKRTGKSGSGGKVLLKVRLDHQVEFGESVVIIGSCKELGSWKNQTLLNWSEDGWICDLELKGDELVEFKFVTVRKDGSLLWESGDNRVLQLPKVGRFSSVYQWNKTGEAVEMLPLDAKEINEGDEILLLDVVEDNKGDENDQEVEAGNGSFAEVGASPFVGQWKGKAISFMRSNEHHSRESERSWHTSGLEGLALQLVEGDKNARNWWRKVFSRIYHFFSSLSCSL